MAKRTRRETLGLALAICVSLALHASAIPFVFHAASALRTRSPLEVDLLMAPRRGRPNGKAEGRGLGVLAPRPEARPRKAKAPVSRKRPASAPKQEASQDPLPAAHAQAQGPAALGAPDGASESGPVLTALPALLNAHELVESLRKLYPVEERRAGRGGRVLLELHIDADGRVASAAVVQSAGAAFDAAALELAKSLRFRPARDVRGPVPVKIRQAIEFKLEA